MSDTEEYTLSDIEEWRAFTPYYPETMDRMSECFAECLKHITDYHNALDRPVSDGETP